MPKGVYVRTDWHKSRLKNLFQEGHKLSVGNDWNKGKPRLEETKQKISNSMKGENNHFYGKHHTLESKERISEKNKGRTAWNRGKVMPIETRIKCSLAQTGKDKFDGFYKSKNSRLRTSKKWVSWREQVFERDDYTCQKCNDKGVMLHPHHIITVKRLIKENNEQLVYSVDNGITLCKSCHMLEHKINGDD